MEVCFLIGWIFVYVYWVWSLIQFKIQTLKISWFSVHLNVVHFSLLVMLNTVLFVFRLSSVLSVNVGKLIFISLICISKYISGETVRVILISCLFITVFLVHALFHLWLLLSSYRTFIQVVVRKMGTEICLKWKKVVLLLDLE